MSIDNHKSLRKKTNPLEFVPDGTVKQVHGELHDFIVNLMEKYSLTLTEALAVMEEYVKDKSQK